MSRSRRKTPVMGITTAVSEKEDKRLANRKLRHLTKSKLRRRDLDLTQLILPQIREVSDVWQFAKDGKQWIDENSKYMRK